MLPERKARVVRYDRDGGLVTLEAGDGGGAAREERGTVLLDGDGRVVGVDVEPDSPSRVVIMRGTHEQVSSTRDAKITVSRDASGAVAWVRVKAERGA
jgi:hypothetical protein